MLTQTTEIAIKALVFLVIRGKDRYIPPHEIAFSMGSSPSYLAKVMGQMVKSGILRSQRGASGGMMLARPPDQINLLEIVEATQGQFYIPECTVADTVGETSSCGLQRALRDVRGSTLHALRSWTLEEVARPPIDPTAEPCACILHFAMVKVGVGGPEGSEEGTPI